VPVDVVIWPDMAIAGTDITVRLTASNLGDATGIGDISVSIDERNLLYKDNATIGPGGTMDLSVVWTSTAGTHALEVKVRTRSGGNRDAGNDLASKTFTILPIPPSPRLLLSLGNDTVRLAPGGLVAVDVWVDCRDNNAGGIILKATLSEGFPVLVEIVSPPPLALDKGESWKSRLVLRATSSPGDTPRSGTVAVSVTGDGAYGARHNISVHILEPAPVRTESPMVAVGAAAAVSVVVVAAVAIGATEIGFVALMSLLLPLYSKIRKEEVLDQFTRGKIQGYITAYPGEHYNSIKAQLGINNGALAYHLKVLEREGYVTSIRDGVYKRYYPKETVIPRRRGQFSQMQEMVLGHIRESPGISQDGLARAMKVSNQVVYYHIRNLMAAGAVRLEKDGKETHCYLSEKIGTGFQGPGAG
jgi:DNA-binding transcriptional ArsR family regulator